MIFLTPASIGEVLRTTSWDETAWDLASLYLLSTGSEPPSGEAPRIVAMSEGTTCFVLMRYFEPDALGLAARRQREWLLEISIDKRETFAYACEAYSRLLVLGEGRSARQALLDAAGPLPVPDDVDGGIACDPGGGGRGPQWLEAHPGGLRRRHPGAAGRSSPAP